VIRPARPDDTSTLYALVVELAIFEGALDEVELTEASLGLALFGPEPWVFCDVAEIDGEVVGSSVWFVSFSTWTGQGGIYLEDLYVRPDARGRGVGRELIATLARRAVERGYRRVEWSVLDWNEGAIALYDAIGARPMSEWTRYRLAGDALDALGRPS
jgi:ribosomal protein S18 acetylase RimI-like enzyme